MNTYIALLRGINVGGRNILPMKELGRLLETLGLANVSTYLASGNVVFQSEATDPARLSSGDLSAGDLSAGDLAAGDLAADISAAIGHNYGFTPQVLIRSLQDFRRAVAANPFPEGESRHKSLHLYFLQSPPADPDLAGLEAIKTANERFALLGSVFYLHAPDGIGRSRLATGVEKHLGVPTTARNWRTTTKVLALAAGLDARGD